MENILFIFNILLTILFTIVLTGYLFLYIKHKKKEHLLISSLFALLIIENGIIALSEFSYSFEKLYETSHVLYVCLYLTYLTLILMSRLIIRHAYDDPFSIKEKIAAVTIPITIVILNFFISYEWLEVTVYGSFYFSIIYLCYRYYINNSHSNKRQLWLLGSLIIISCVGVIEVIEYFASYQETTEIIVAVTLDYRNLSFDLIKLILSIIAIRKVFKDFEPSPSRTSIDDHIKTLIAEYDLTNRQEEIVRLIVKGHSNKEIAQSLFITEGTVKTHIHNIFRKADISNRNQLLTKIMDKSDL